MADQPDDKEKEGEADSSIDAHTNKEGSAIKESGSDHGSSAGEDGSKSKQREQENIPASNVRNEISGEESDKTDGKSAFEETMTEFLKQGEKKPTKAESLPLIAKLIGEALEEKPKNTKESAQQAQQSEDNGSSKKAASEMEERIKNMVAETKKQISAGKKGTNHKELEDEWIRFRLFVHLPIITFVSILALLGTVIERGLGFFCGFLSSQCEEIAGKCEGFLQTALLKTGAALAFVSRHSIAMGKALRESSLMMMYFWLAYWKMLDLGGNGPVARVGFLKEAFEGKAVIDKPILHEKTD